MSVERMKLLGITGKSEVMNNFLIKYIINSGLQLEDAIKVYEKGWKLTYFDYNTKPRELVKNIEKLMEKLGVEYSKQCLSDIKIKNSLEDIEEKIHEINNNIKNITNNVIEKQEEINKIKKSIEPFQKLKNSEIQLEKLYDLKYMRFRFGKISKENYESINKEIENMNCIMFKVDEDSKDVWIIYFTTDEYSAEVDSFFNVLKFERIWIDRSFSGKPKEILKKLEDTINEDEKYIENSRNTLDIEVKNSETVLLQLYRELQLYEKIEFIKKYLAHDKNGDFYLIGWIPIDELEKIVPLLEKEKKIKYIVKSHYEVATNPPTHLKNNKLFRKFETIVEMYGMPNYEELDPTVFVAITAFIMFGFMFGDVGQGAIIMLIGLWLSRKKKSLGPIFVAGGISAIIFGVLYGSVFGKEDIIPSILIRPMENITTMLISGIAFGVILIILAIILNIKNGITNKNIKKAVLSENGIAGLLFYATVIGSIAYYFVAGKMIVSINIIIAICIIELAIILFKDKLEQLITKKKEETESGVAEQIFELIETLLSFVSNTISFVRLAAFAINHVGLCMAVYILANMISGAGNIAIAIIGNAIVIVLEGLIVAIQVLRLEYYELFSRFYSGDGRPYKPIKKLLNEE